MNTSNVYEQWVPIQPLGDDDPKVDLTELNSLQAAWKTVQDRLKLSDSLQLKEFREKLLRSWSIETGIIERLYDLDEGTTQTLVESGFIASLVDRSSTNIEPSALITILEDQQEAAEFVVTAVREGRPLSRHLLLTLHALLTRHQENVEAVDQFDRTVYIPLLRGEFKKQPNNPTRPDGKVYQYCPPTQVVGEIDRLFEWLDEYQDRHPVIVAAWLHHRFVQIHPFQDGNGRVARCLVAMVLLRGDWLPLVVGRHYRPAYIEALEKADKNNLTALVELFGTLEQDVLIKAVSSAGAPELLPQPTLGLTSVASPTLIDEVAGGIAARLRLRKENELATFRRVNELALELLEEAKRDTQHLLRRAAEGLNKQSAVRFELLAMRGEDEGGHHLKEREHYFRNQIIQTARSQGHWANLNEAHYWFRRAMHGAETRLTFVVSFHHIGRELTGVMETTCFAQIDYFDYETGTPTLSDRDYIPCTTRPFTFTWQDDVDVVRNRLAPWLNECFALALRSWGEVL